MRIAGPRNAPGPAFVFEINRKVVDPVDASSPQPTARRGGWQLGSEGRKLCAGTALLSATGVLHEIGKATWIRRT